MKKLGVIPARHASSRFPGKPLAVIDGKSMVQRVYEQATKSRLDEVIVATDDSRILDHVKGFGGKAVMTSSKHKSGTERCFEALEKAEKEFDVVINIQGDEPFIDPEQINELLGCFDKPDTAIATLARQIEDTAVLQNTNITKVIFDNHSNAVYFSRLPLPYQKGVAIDNWLENIHYYKHIGIYGYRSEILKEITRLEPVEAETAESLEQLRWLMNGYKIKVSITEFESVSVDTPEDLEEISKKKKS